MLKATVWALNNFHPMVKRRPDWHELLSALRLGLTSTTLSYSRTVRLWTTHVAITAALEPQLRMSQTLVKRRFYMKLLEGIRDIVLDNSIVQKIRRSQSLVTAHESQTARVTGAG